MCIGSIVLLHHASHLLQWLCMGAASAGYNVRVVSTALGTLHVAQAAWDGILRAVLSILTFDLVWGLLPYRAALCSGRKNAKCNASSGFNATSVILPAQLT